MLGLPPEGTARLLRGRLKETQRRARVYRKQGGALCNAMRPGGHGRHHSNPYLAIAARALPQLDPAQVIHADVLSVPGVSEYVSILLAEEFPLAEVRVLLAHSLDRLIRAREPWSVAAHFMDNVLLVLGRLGWSLDDVDTILTDEGRVLRLLELGPAGIKRQVQCATARWADALALRGHFPPVALLWHPVTTVAKRLSNWGKGCLALLVAGGAWTQARLHETGGSPSSACQYYWHTRRQRCLAEHSGTLRRLIHSSSEEQVARLLFPRSFVHFRRPSESEDRIRIEGQIQSDTWYTDASGFHPSTPHLRMITWSAVQITELGTPTFKASS
eukprot:6341797-Amphidinium_carterae.1